MKNLLILLFILISTIAYSQTEPRLHPAQIGAYGSSNNDILVSNGTTTEFKSIATLGLDNSSTNEIQTLAISGTSSPLTLDISGTSSDVTFTAGSGISLTGTSTNVTITATDASTTNELQTITASGTGSSYAIDLSNSGGSVGLIAGTNITISRTGNDLTFSTSGSADGSATNEGLLTVGLGGANTSTINSNTSGSNAITIDGGTASATGINITENTSTHVISITANDVANNNEGSLTVAPGSSTTSIINSNTTGSTGVTLTASTGLTIGETGNVITLTNSAPDQTVAITGAGISAVTGTYPNFTVTSTEVDGSVTNEAQTLSRGSLTVNTLSLTTAGGAGGGTVNVEDELTIEEFTPTAGATSVTTTAATPSSENKIRVERNGIVQNVGASKGVSSITNEGNASTVINFTRAISTGEIVRVIFPKQ